MLDDRVTNERRRYVLAAAATTLVVTLLSFVGVVLRRRELAGVAGARCVSLAASRVGRGRGGGGDDSWCSARVGGGSGDPRDEGRGTTRSGHRHRSRRPRRLCQRARRRAPGVRSISGRPGSGAPGSVTQPDDGAVSFDAQRRTACPGCFSVRGYCSPRASAHGSPAATKDFCTSRGSTGHATHHSTPAAVPSVPAAALITRHQRPANAVTASTTRTGVRAHRRPSRRRHHRTGAGMGRRLPDACDRRGQPWPTAHGTCGVGGQGDDQRRAPRRRGRRAPSDATTPKVVDASDPPSSTFPPLLGRRLNRLRRRGLAATTAAATP